MYQAKTPADNARTAEYLTHLFRCGIGYQIKILGMTIEQQIAHCTTDHKCLVASRLQALGHLARGRADAVAADAMYFKRNDVAFALRPDTGSFSEYALEQFFYHCALCNMNPTA